MSEKAYRVILLPRAKQDIYKIWHDTSLQNPVAADKFIDKLDLRVLSLIELPDRGVPRDDLKKGLRMLVEGRFLIFYRVQGTKVEIIRVVHGAMDLPKIFN
jgi:toxin ParE1/3/4